MPAATYHHDGQIATLTLSFPPENRLGDDVLRVLVGAMPDLQQRNDTRALLIQAEGPDFSLGGDIRQWRDNSAQEFSARMQQGLEITNVLEQLPFPVVVAVQGRCRGGGFELALRGDIIVASDDAQFGHSEATIGVFTFLGGIQRVADRIGRTRAMQWALTAQMIPAQTALDVGLVNEVVPRDELPTAAQRWVTQLANGATRAHADHKRLLRAWSDGGVAAADSLIPSMAGQILHSRDVQRILSAAIEAFEDGRPRPAFEFTGE